MPYSQIVLTAGISFFAPNNLLGAWFREDGSPLEFTEGSHSPQPKITENKLIPACAEWAARKISTTQKIDLRRISAEVSMLHGIQSQGRAKGKGLAKGAIVHLIHTRSLAGRLAVEIQSDLIETQFPCTVRCHELSIPFDPSIPGGLSLASGAFIDQICRLLKHSDPHTTAFAPIGGYKCMVALGHTAASFYGFPSLYLHEESQQLQEIAAIPFHLDGPSRADLAETVRKLSHTCEWQELESNDRETISKNPAFFTRIEGLVELNELGHFLQLDLLPVLLSPRAKLELNKGSPELRQQIDQLHHKAQTDPAYPGINHTWVSLNGARQNWRIARMGEGNRITWQITPEALVIQAIWTSHDQYEKEAGKLITCTLPSEAELKGYDAIHPSFP